MTLTIGQSLEARLKGYTNLASLVSTRVYPVKLMQGSAMPAVTHRQVSGQRAHSIDGYSGLMGGRFQVDSWGTTIASARAVGKQVRLALAGYTGVLGTNGVTAVCEMLGEMETLDTDTGNYRVIQDYEIWHQEATS